MSQPSTGALKRRGHQVCVSVRTMTLQLLDISERINELRSRRLRLTGWMWGVNRFIHLRYIGVHILRRYDHSVTTESPSWDLGHVSSGIFRDSLRHCLANRILLLCSNDAFMCLYQTVCTPRVTLSSSVSFDCSSWWGQSSNNANKLVFSKWSSWYESIII